MFVRVSKLARKGSDAKRCIYRATGKIKDIYCFACGVFSSIFHIKCRFN